MSHIRTYIFSTCILSLLSMVMNAQIGNDLETAQRTSMFDNILNQAKVQGDEFSYCDEDGDGFLDINIHYITEQVLLNNGLGNGDNEAVLISTRDGNIIKLNTPSIGGTVEVICSLQGSLADVAVDEEGVIFANRFTEIFELDVENCSTSTLFDFPFGTEINSLSFDIVGNMYYGEGGSAKVYRYNADETSAPYVWHDFGLGHAAGDFVMLRGKLYIAWNFDNDYKLLEVIVDANFNYVSHIDLGEIPEMTYGLVSELGRLYGITPAQLYEIDLENFTFETKVGNNGNYGDWWGAAGLHEAVILEATAFINEADANNNVNQLPSPWTNTIAGGQLIYVRIENIENGEYYVLPVTIFIYNTPQITDPADIVICDEEKNNIVDLTQVEPELLANVTDPVEVSYHNTYDDATNGLAPLDTMYQVQTSEEMLFIRVKNIENRCFAVIDFHLFVRTKPRLAPLVMDPSERLLETCHINTMDEGYFKLTEIYDQVVIDGVENYSLEFYKSFENAELGINSLPDIYFSTLGLIEEIFVKVTNDDGCSSITNFFIDGDCVLNTEDISGIHFGDFFTPNGDSYHDYWNVTGISQKLKKQSIVHIFDRYGKLIKSFVSFGTEGWDGYYNGNPAPSNDYWYSIVTPNGQKFSGHFTLKR